MTDHIDIDDEHRKLLYALNRADLSLAEYAAREAALSALVAVVRTRLAWEAFWDLSQEGAIEAMLRACSAADAAMEPFRPVAPSATDAAATGGDV